MTTDANRELPFEFQRNQGLDWLADSTGGCNVLLKTLCRRFALSDVGDERELWQQALPALENGCSGAQEPLSNSTSWSNTS